MKKLIVLAIFLIIGVLAFFIFSQSSRQSPKANYVGTQTCASCHSDIHKQWKGSHHDMAFDVANEKTVLAPFKGETLTTKGVTTKFYQKDGKYMIDTVMPSGNAVSLTVRHVIGITPLQQYLVDYPKGQEGKWGRGDPIGTLQTMPMSWDTEKKEWFHLYPHETFTENDPIHWSGWAQNWNHMCADCHMTDLKKGANPKTNLHQTTYKEMNVACEACHGPGSNHVADANSMMYFVFAKPYGMGNIHKNDPKKMMDTCAKCHSFRDQFRSGYDSEKPFEDFYQVHLLDDEHYFHDGQIKEEVYVYGSYLQSKMHRMGVTCLNCHDPHSNKIRLPGNALCYQCHDPKVFGEPSHHHHKMGSTGASCVECHMPERTYMGIDRRRDHSIRVPRPDLSLKIGSPNACVGCHLHPERKYQSDEYAKLLSETSSGNQQAKDKLHELNTWANTFVQTWNGGNTMKKHYGETFAEARGRVPGAEAELIAISSDNVHYGTITRATALSLLVQYFSEDTNRRLVNALYDDDPMLRRAALMGQANKPSVDSWIDRLKDPILSVRLEAFQNILQLPPEQFNQVISTPAGQKIVKEFKQRAMYHADQAGSHMNLARYYELIRSPDAAINSYRTAIKIQPQWTGPRSNLSALLVQLGQEKEAIALRKEEVKLLERDCRLAPHNHGLHYRYGLMNYMLHDYSKATTAIEKACKMDPNNSEYRWAFMLLLEKLNQIDKALEVCDQLIRLSPQDQRLPGYKQKLLQQKQ